MSTTSSLRTAVEYSMSKRSLIFCIRTTNKLQRGVNLEWISAFSRESETLFPPLTYLQPTGRTQVGCRYPTVTHRYLSLPHPPARRRSPSVSAAARRPPTPRPTRSAPASSADSRCRAPAGGRGWRHALHHRRGHRHHRLNGKQCLANNVNLAPSRLRGVSNGVCNGREQTTWLRRGFEASALNHLGSGG
jgi:hypothetical protein